MRLLTGFDAPCDTVLCIDKRLRDHSILQAIARANRLFDGKTSGWSSITGASLAHSTLKLPVANFRILGPSRLVVR